MSNPISKEILDKLIEKYHAIYEENNYNSWIGGIDYKRKRYLKSLNVIKSSMLMDPHSVKYSDYDNGTHIYYQLPYKKRTKEYNEAYGWAFVKNNESNRIKFITCGGNPKMEYVKNPEIVTWRGMKCIRVRKC